jgi:hypothetical protein
LFPFGYPFPHTFATLFGMLVYHKAENAKWDAPRAAPTRRHVKKKVLLPEYKKVISMNHVKVIPFVYDSVKSVMIF